jgi:anti-sigma-K factor RskA
MPGIGLMSYDEDHIAMAAEYVLGTLDGDERAQVETMMSVDPEFKLVVEQWERRLGELHAMVGAVEPADEVWGKIRTAVAAIAPEAAMRLPEVTSVPAAAPPPVVQPITPNDSNVVQLSDRGRRWRGIAQLATALAACLGAFIAVQAYRPDLLPEKMRPQGKVEVVTAPRAAQYVAVFQAPNGPPAFIMTVDTSTKEFTVRKAGPDAPSGRAYELWIVPAGATGPTSLGVIGATDFTTKTALSSFDGPTIQNATYAVTVEPAGGSPTGQPTVAPIPIYAGKLIETVPSASTAPPAKR